MREWSRLVGLGLWGALSFGATATAGAQPNGTGGIEEAQPPPPVSLPLTTPLAAGERREVAIPNGPTGWVTRVNVSGEGPRSPTLANGMVFVGSGFGGRSMYAYDLDSGDMMRTFNLGENGPTAAVASSSQVVWGTESCIMYGESLINAAHWQRWLGPYVTAAPALAGRRMLQPFQGNDGRFWIRSYDQRGRPARWSTELFNHVVDAPVVAGNAAYMTTTNGDVFRIDTRRGGVAWRIPASAAGAPWPAGDVVWLARNSAAGVQTVALAADTGAVVRELEALAPIARPGAHTPWGTEGPRPALVGGRLYEAAGAVVRAHDPASGTVLWTWRQPGTAAAPTAPMVAGPYVIVATAGGRIHGLDATTGAHRFTHELGESIINQPVADDGWLVAVSERGLMVGLRIEAADGWPQWGGTAQHVL